MAEMTKIQSIKNQGKQKFFFYQFYSCFQREKQIKRAKKTSCIFKLGEERLDSL